MSKWWLVSDEALNIVQQALEAPTHKKNDDNCQEWSSRAGCQACAGNKLRRRAMHELSCGTHVTDAVPDDFKEEDK